MAREAIAAKFEERSVSIPKRVSEVLWPPNRQRVKFRLQVSIPKRVSEVLWQRQRIDHL